MLDLGAFQPVPGRIFDVEFDFQVKSTQFGEPDGKNKEKENYEKLFFTLTLK